MTDSQTPRPTLKLSIKPVTLESLTNRIPKQTVVVPNKVEPKVIANKKDERNNKPNNSSPQQSAVNKPVAVTPPPQQEKVLKKPKAESIPQVSTTIVRTSQESIPQVKKVKESTTIVSTSKERTPPPVLQPYDFFEVYTPLHVAFRAVISLKNPKALAIGIQKSIKEESGLSKKNAAMWTAEYLRRSQYYKKAHVAGANRYNLQGEIVGVVSQEQFDARVEMFKNFKKK